jgi:conjugal transfer pilus assembly protein TraW
MTTRWSAWTLAMALAALAVAAPGAGAIDLGVIGPTYEIREPHLLAFIEQRLRDKEKSGELRRLMDEARQRGSESIRHPAAVVGVRTTERARTFYIDPTFTLDRNVVDSQGQMLFPAGTRKNPLEVVTLSRRLFFFDGRDRRQVAQARDLVARANGGIKPILTGGSYLDLMRSWRIPVYYDQQGTLTRRLGIQQVPAVVTQEGMRLRIDEVLVRPLIP